MSMYPNPPLVAGTAEPCLPPHLSRPFVRSHGAAEIIEFITGAPCSPRTLATWRCRGGGPPFRKIRGRHVVYAPTDLIAWVAATMSDAVSSTSEVQL